MLQEYKQMKLSEYRKLYDIIVPKDHILRKIKDNIDFSFVNPLKPKKYLYAIFTSAFFITLSSDKSYKTCKKSNLNIISGSFAVLP